MGGIATWVFLPSIALTLVRLLAIAVNRAFHSAGWAWAKLATGVLIFEWGFAGIQGPMQQEAELSARALAGEVRRRYACPIARSGTRLALAYCLR